MDDDSATEFETLAEMLLLGWVDRDGQHQYFKPRTCCAVWQFLVAPQLNATTAGSKVRGKALPPHEPKLRLRFMARPSSYSPVILPVVRACATFGATAEEIANYLNIPWGSFKRWIYANPELREALKRGRDASDERVIDSLYRQALAGNVGAICFWLKNRRPAEWRDVQHLDQAVGHYIVSDKPMSEEQWIAERTKVIEAKVVQPLSDTE